MGTSSSPVPAKIPPEATLLDNSVSAMFAAVEIHNKPVFKYRYEVCTLLAVNAWELALKAYIAKELKTVKLFQKDGTTKPFLECVACVSSTIGKSFEPVRHNLELLYEYRNKIAHFFPDELDIVILGLLKAAVLFYAEFVERHFGRKLYDECNLVLLPIGFSKPLSPLDFISNQSASKHCSAEVKDFLQSIRKSCDSLETQGITESVIVNYSVTLVNESRIKNADLTAAINNASPQQNVIAVNNIIAAAAFSNDPSAKQVRIEEDSIYSKIFTETYGDVVENARKRFSDFIQNKKFNEVMRKLKKNPNIMRTRLLNPNNPKGGHKDFYSKRVYEELGKVYKAR